jgi:NAD(P)-dependent dehydrogenase (short-subunit alcohol dehydrogenase family)
MVTYLITGCSRGLGLALATKLARILENKVFATSRGDPILALEELLEDSQGRVSHVQLDVTSRSVVEKAEKEIAESMC